MAFISTKSPLWLQILSTAEYDLYHLPGFAELEAGLLKGKALAWHVNGNGFQALIPLIERPITMENQTFFDLVSPYGYPGILSTKTLTTSEASAIFFDFHGAAASHGYISSFIRLNPILNPWQINPITPGGESIFCRQWFHGGTVSVNLEADISEIRKSFSNNHGRNLRRLWRLNHKAHLNNWAHLDAFRKAYQQTMQRRAAHPYYFFPEAYFQSLKQLLKDALVFISISDSQGAFVSGGLFTHLSGVIQYHLGATLNSAIPFSPSKMMMDEAIQYGITKNARLLHLGGGLGGSTTDGLFRFKKGFGRQYHPFSSLRFIHHNDQYNKLKHHKTFAYKRNDYFPEYRFQTT